MVKNKSRLCFAIACLALVVLQVACGLQERRIQQNGFSMMPNFADGDTFKIVQTPLSELERGDLVLVKVKNNSLLKRLIGLPNETISIHDGTIFIDGNALVEPYEVTAPDYTEDEIKLDSDSYFVLGDNRPNSSDSHSFGPIKGSDIEGEAIPENLSDQK